MSTKHNTKHPSRGKSSYPRKIDEQGRSPVLDPMLSDGKRASASRGGTGK